MRQKVKTTPIQRAMLSSLAETGERSLPAMLDTLQSEWPENSPEVLLKSVERSLGILSRMGCLYIARQYGPERKTILADEMQSLSLERLVEWDEPGSRWIVNRQEPVPDDITVQLTNGGVEILELIREQSSGAPTSFSDLKM